MTFLGLRKREVNEDELVPEARSVLDRVSQGHSIAEAAQLVGVDAELLRGWRRDPAYRLALKRAKSEDREPHFYSWDAPDAGEYDANGIPLPGSRAAQGQPGGFRGRLDSSSGVNGPMFGGLGTR